MAKEKVTSVRIAALAAHVLADPKTAKQDRQLAASALSQAATKRRKRR